MRGPLIPSPFWATLIVCLIAVNLLVSEIEAKRSSGSRKSGSSSSGGFFSSRKKTNNQQPQPTQHKPPSQPSPSSSGSFLDNERKTGGHVGSGQPVGNRPGGNNPIGFEHYNNRQPSAPLPPGHQPTGGLGSAFGGAKPNNPPYPTHNNPGGFGSNPGGFGSNPGGFGSNTGHHPQGGYNSPGGFGSNTGGFGHNQGGFGSNTGHHPQGGYNSPGGFGGNTGGFGGNTGGFGGNTGGFGHNQGGFGSNTGGHHPQGGYNAPGGGFGGTHHNSQPGYGNQPHYNQPGGYHGGQQHGYGGGAPGYHPPANSYGSYPAGYGGQPHYGGGHSPQYNPGGFGGGYHPSGGYGGYGGQGYMPGGKVKSGPGIGTGLLGGAAAALPLGLLVGYGLGSMGSHSSPFSGSSHSAAPASPAAAAAPANNDAFNEWLKQRTAEEKKKEEAAIAAGAVAGGAAAAGAAGAASSVLINKDGVTTVNETALVSRILEQTSMCPGGAGILEASFLNTLVPCNATEVDFQETNLTIPYEDDCKTIKMTLIQLNPTTNENKSVSLTIKQINVESGLPGDLAYDMSFDSCLSAIGKPEEKFCVNRGFTIDQYHTINETLAFLHTANFSITQFNTTLFPNMSCPNGGDCANKETRNLTSTFVNLSLLPLHPVTLLMSQCMIFNRSQCDPASTQPCDLPQLTVKQSIDTNTTLSTVDFASINFVLHGSKDIFLTFQPPPPPPQEKAAQNADQVGSSSTLTDTTTKSSATTI